MKTRIFLLASLLLFAITLQAQTYVQLWKNVEQLEQRDLPGSVVAEAQKIYRKAKVERNVPQMMKAYLTMMAGRERISPDSVAVDIKGLEDWAEETTVTPADRAVLYSILGGVCIGDDFAKGNRYLHLSLKDSLALMDESAEKLVPMVVTGETSRLYWRNNLYDLLARRAIGIWEQNQWRSERETVLQTIRQTYQSLLQLYRERNMRAAWLLTALDAFPQADGKQLREWVNEYGDLEVCAEVYLRLAQQGLPEGEPAERLALLREGIVRYPNYNRIHALKNEEREILAPRLNLSVYYTYPGEAFPMQVQHRNLRGFTLHVYRLDLPVDSPLLVKVNSQTIRQYGHRLYQMHFDLPATPDYKERRDTLKVDALEAGLYYLEAVPDGHPKVVQGQLLTVTALQVISRALPDGRQEWVVLDKQSGHPVPNTQMNTYRKEGNGFVRTATYTARVDGVIEWKSERRRPIYFQAQTPTDRAMPITIAWSGSYTYEVTDQEQEHVRLFTDRALYRPGQKLFYSGIAYRQQKDSVRAKEGSSYTVTLLNVENQEVARQQVITDAFGTFHGTFELPASGKLGVYRLKAGKGLVTFRVEAYKRPTFEVTFDTVRTAYQPGDSIRVTGVARTLTGVPVQGAKVNYQVVRRENNFWRMRGMETNRVTGEAVTDDKGRFEVPVYFLPLTKENPQTWYQTYEVLADVTARSGETQEASLDLPLGSSSLRLFIPDWEGMILVKEYPTDLTFQVNNLMNVPIETEVEYRVWTKDKPVEQGKAVSNRSFLPKEIYALPSGTYRLEATVTDEAGKKQEQTVTFTLLSLKDSHLPEGLDFWVYSPNEEFNADGQATVYVGSRAKNVYLFMDVFGENKPVEEKRMVFSDSLMAFRYTYREAYGDGLRYSLAYLKEGQLLVRNLYVKKPQPDKTLLLQWKTFRDRLQPGASETWTLRILHPDGRPADAQLMATLYDASLDRLTKLYWRFDLNFERSSQGTLWGPTGMQRAYWYFTFPPRTLKVHPLEYSRLWVPSYGARVENFLLEDRSLATGKPVMMKAASHAQVTVAKEEVSLRTNFAETAFFYPQLRTDSAGEVNLEFTLPESLTEWKFMGLAHTQTMDYGSLSAEVIARKEYMLQPHWPRFVRVGDRVTVVASLTNLSEVAVGSQVQFELLTPDTKRRIAKQQRPITVQARETGTIAFEFKVPKEYEGLIVRMTAESERFSDGEQRYLPVLNNQERMVESVLLDVHAPGTSTFSLEELFNRHSKTVTHPRMWVEFTNNPLVYAVQALPVLRNPDNQNALSWAAAYYANSLTDYLVRVKPLWAESLQTDSLSERISEALGKLKDLQEEDGAWSWYKGMSGSRYMTTQIVELMARLQRMTGRPLEAASAAMYQKAFTFLTKEAAHEKARMQEAEKRGVVHGLPSEQVLRYLYVTALSRPSDLSSEMNTYFIHRLVKQSASQTIYGKALAAIVLHYAGKEAEAREYLQSLLEYSVVTERMGRYFDTKQAPYSWFSYKIPAQVAAMEALQLLHEDEQALEQMKQWLLKQKQVQAWETPIATVNAVYALLTMGKVELQPTGTTELVVGKEVLRTPDNPLGKVKQEIPGKVTAIDKVVVKKKSAGIGWGAVYAVFEEALEKVASQGRELKVERSLYRNGKPLSDQEILEVGDQLTIRLTVTSDRDLDFVQIKDEYAACLEPVQALSGIHRGATVGYYQEIRDASTSFFVDKLYKGVHHLEYKVTVAFRGQYRQGIPRVRSVYAPEMNGHGDSRSLLVK